MTHSVLLTSAKKYKFYALLCLAAVLGTSGCHSGGRHHNRQGDQYPSSPGHQYPSSPGHQYPSSPGHQYPSSPGHQYPARRVRIIRVGAVEPISIKEAENSAILVAQIQNQRDRF